MTLDVNTYLKENAECPTLLDELKHHQVDDGPASQALQHRDDDLLVFGGLLRHGEADTNFKRADQGEDDEKKTKAEVARGGL